MSLTHTEAAGERLAVAVRRFLRAGRYRKLLPLKQALLDFANAQRQDAEAQEANDLQDGDQ